MSTTGRPSPNVDVTSVTELRRRVMELELIQSSSGMCAHELAHACGEKVVELVDAVNDLETKLNEVIDIVRDAANGWDAALEAHSHLDTEQRLAELERRLTRAEAEGREVHGQLDGSLVHNAGDRAGMRQDIDRLAARVAALEAELTGTDAAVATLNDRVSALENGAREL